MSSPLLAVEDAGRGETLILLHGLATSSVIWEASLPALARGRRVLTVDLPGFGGSAPAGADFELKVVAERIARGIAARGFRGPVDLGYRIGLTWRSCRSSLRFVTLGSLFGPGVAELGRFRALRYARPIRARPRWCGTEARRPRPDSATERTGYARKAPIAVPSLRSMNG